MVLRCFSSNTAGSMQLLFFEIILAMVVYKIDLAY